MFNFLIIYFVISIAFVGIINPLISNFLQPSIQNNPYGSIGISLMYLLVSVIWFLIPIMAVSSYLRGGSGGAPSV